MNTEVPAERFRRLFADTERELLAYVLRRVERAEDAADVVAETYLVAWRRMDKVPAGDEARLWLYGVARRQLATSAAASCGASAWPTGCVWSCRP